MYEEQVHEAEEKYILDQSDSNRSALHEINGQNIEFLKFEDTSRNRKSSSNGLKMVTPTPNILTVL